MHLQIMALGSKIASGTSTVENNCAKLLCSAHVVKNCLATPDPNWANQGFCSSTVRNESRN